MYPPSIEKLIKIFCRFPAIGPRTATRFAFYCLNSSPQEIDEFIAALKEVKEKVNLCKSCFRSVESGPDTCAICSNPKRNKDMLCVVEKETDLISIEKTGEYNGLYFILGGTVSPLRREDLKQIRAEELKRRVEGVKEVIIATNQNTEGEATAIFITRILNSLGIKTTRLGRGLSTGSELEYADEETLSFALRGRK